MTESQDMKYEEVRLNTFRSWPANAKVEAWKMAKAGLLYTGQSEQVKCTFCGCVLTDWQYGDQVMSRHRQANPTCPFVQNLSDNVPLGSAAASRQDDQRSMTSFSEANHSNDDFFSESGLASGEEEDTDDAGANMNQTWRASSTTATDNSPGSSPMDTTHMLRHHDEMRRESKRLASFANWSISFIRPADLAKAGFYYVNQRDNCRCAFCDNFVGDWEEGDVPREEHEKLFPLCGYVQGNDVGNIPIEAEARPGSSAAVPSAGEDETGLRYSRRPHSASERGFTYSQTGDTRLADESLGIISHDGPMHPAFATPEARIRTFREWPPALKQQPQELANAGFYYIGLSDQVKCFYCDGGLRNWQPEDDPWVEHARYFSKCVFVRLRKGDEFIRECIETKPPEEIEVPAGVTEEDIKAVMSEAIVKQVLSMGIDHTRVKMAIKKQLEKYGSSFDSVERLITATFSVQYEQERRVQQEHRNPSGAVLGEQRRSVDEVTSRHWEEELQQDPNYASTSPPEMPTFRSLPSGVKLNSHSNNANTSTSVRTAASSSNSSNTSSSTITTEPNPVSVVVEAKSVQETAAHKPEKNSSDAAAESLEVENARLKEQRTCKVCMDGEVGVVFLPCGHLICCVNCAPSLKDCPVCRGSIHGTVRTFMS